MILRNTDIYLTNYAPFTSYGGADKSLAMTRNETSYIPRILWNLEVHYHIHKSLPPVPALAKSIHSSAHHILIGAACFLPGRAKDLSAPR